MEQDRTYMSAISAVTGLIWIRKNFGAKHAVTLAAQVELYTSTTLGSRLTVTTFDLFMLL